MNTKLFLTAFICASLTSTGFAQNKEAQSEATQDPNAMVAYLFTYFNSNDPKDEQICYAISDDGYNFTPLNHGNPVISSDTIALTHISCAAKTARHSIWLQQTCAQLMDGQATEEWCCSNPQTSSTGSTQPSISPLDTPKSGRM